MENHGKPMGYFCKGKSKAGPELAAKIMSFFGKIMMLAISAQNERDMSMRNLND